MIRLFLTLPFLLAACLKDETISGYADPNVTYQLVEINGVAFTSAASIAFREEGSVTGSAPCNTFAAAQTAPYPWFKLAAIRVTRAACPELAQEQEFIAALQGMSLIEVSGDVLILRNEANEEMIFQASRR